MTKRRAAKRSKAPAAEPTEADLLRVLAGAALDGDRSAGLSLLRRFGEALDDGQEIPAEVLHYIGRAIEAYLAGRVKSLDSALGLDRPKHREGGKRRDRHDEIAERVLELQRRGSSLGDAKGAAAREFGVVERTVERALRALMASLTPAEIEALKG